MDWPADRIERRPTEALIPYARNARTHSDTQIEQIAASIQEWGWTTPVLIDDKGGIIAGHGRVLAALSLGLEEVPVVLAQGWTQAQRQAYTLADNKLAQNADWDSDLLRIELADLSTMTFDISTVGFAQGELDNLLGEQYLPGNNKAIDEDEFLETKQECPKCGFRW